jgi:large subunit ribosomal protein L22
MSKPKTKRQLSDKEAKAVTRSIRVNTRKLNEVAASIRGKKVATALAMLTFSNRRIAKDVKKTLESAIANAENNHDLDINNLVVAQAWTGKNLVMKRWFPDARGRVGHIHKFFSELTIVVREAAPEAKNSKEAA